MSKPTDESYRHWLDTEYSKGLTGGEALRSAFDSGAKWQREGSWPWALEQMKAGHRVTNTNTRGYYEFTDALSTAGAVRFLTLYSPDGVPCSQGTLLMPEDFDATDWRVVE